MGVQNRSVFHFLIFLVIGLAATVFVTNKGIEAIADADSLENAPVNAWRRPGFEERMRASDTAGWKTYRNEEYGFEVEYPQKWSVFSAKMRGAQFRVRFDAGIQGEANADIYVERSNKTVEEWRESSFPDIINSTKRLAISGESALRINTNEFGISYIGMRHNGNFFVIAGNTLDPILPTFRFIK